MPPKRWHCVDFEPLEMAGIADAYSPDAVKATHQPVGKPPTDFETEYWLIFFEEAGKTCELFTDEVAARHRHKRLLANWNCHVFKRAGENL